jgi:hydrogenase maturation factor
MTRPAQSCPTGEEHCITCGDEGIAVRVLALREDGIAVCADAGEARHEVATDLVGPVAVGDELLVHAGVAIALLEGAPR